MLWNWIEATESLFSEINEFLVILNTTSNNKALSWSDVVHNELLKHSSIDVVNILIRAKSWHTEALETIGSSKQKLGV